MCFLILFGDACGGVPGSNLSAIDPLPSPSVSNADDATEDRSVVDVVLGLLRKLQVFAETNYDDFIDWCMDFLGPTRDEFPGLAVNVEVAQEKVLQERALAIDIAPIEDEEDNVNDQYVTALLPTAAVVAQDPMPAMATDQVHVIDIAAMNERDCGDNVAESTTSFPVGVSRSAVMDADLESMPVTIETSQAAVVNIVQPAPEAIPSIAAVLLADPQQSLDVVTTSLATMVADVESLRAAGETNQHANTSSSADAQESVVEDKELQSQRGATRTPANATTSTVDVAADLEPLLEAIPSESHAPSVVDAADAEVNDFLAAEVEARASRATRRTVVPLPVRLAYRPLFLFRLPEQWLDGVRVTDVFRCEDDLLCLHDVCSDVRDALGDFVGRFRSETRRYRTLKSLVVAVAAQYPTVKINDSLIQYLVWELAVHDYQLDQTFARVISSFAIPTVTRERAD